VTVAPPNQFVSDGGVVYAFSNIPLAFIGAAEPTVAGQYGMFPSGTYVFGPADQGKPIVITYTAGSAGNFTPNLTPAYALSDTDFVDEKGNKDPVQVERVDVFSLPTISASKSCHAGTNIPLFPSRRATKARSRFSAHASAPPFKPTRSATNS